MWEPLLVVSSRVGAGVIVIGSILACGDAPAGGPDATGGASADATAVEGAPSSAGGWRFVPDVRVDGEREVLVSVGGLAVSDAGWFAITQRQEHAIRFFDMSGSPLGRIGRQGRGPGEFEGISSIGWKADTLWVWDFQQRRITYISPRREFVRDALVANAAPRPADQARLPQFARPTPRAVYPDGSMLASASLSRDDAGRCPECGPQLVRISADGHVERILGWLPKNNAFVSFSTATGIGSIRVPFRGDPVDASAIDGSVTAMGVAAVEGEDRFSS